MNKVLPHYKVRISKNDSSETQLAATAGVFSPATEIQWQTFGKQINFSVDNERRLITGPLMVANMPIYRNDKDLGEYYVSFDSEAIYDIVLKATKKGTLNSFNIEHDKNKKVDGLYVIESFFVDESRGVRPPKAFEGISQGSYIITVKCDNDDYWQRVKRGEIRGWSAEGSFNMVLEGALTGDVARSIAETVKPNNFSSTSKTIAFTKEEEQSIIRITKALTQYYNSQVADKNAKRMIQKANANTMFENGISMEERLKRFRKEYM